MDLKRPPVIEAWIEFHFSPNESGQLWTPSYAAKFVERLEFEFKPYDTVWQTEGSASINQEGKVVASAPPEAHFMRIRARSPEEDRVVQVGNDHLIYNVVRTSAPWPGFSQWSEEAMSVLQSYIEYAHPNDVTQIAVHYRDELEIPVTDNAVDLREYLTLYYTYPRETFGNVMLFNSTFLFAPTENGEVLAVTLQSPPSDGSEARVRLDWHCVSNGLISPDRDSVAARVISAHHHVREAFHKGLTKRAFNELCGGWKGKHAT